jgi:tetratricopeptide (TPR) repeat protein
MKRFGVIALLASFCSLCSAQNVEWALFWENGVYDVSPFHNGIASVQMGTDYFAINKKGEKLFELPGIIISVDNDRFITKKSLYQYCLTNNQGKILSKEYSKITKWKDCYIVKDSKTNRRGVIDRNGKEILPCKYERIENSEQGNYTVIKTESETDGLIDKDGHIILQPKYRLLDKNAVTNDNLPVICYKDKKNQYAFIKSSQKVIDYTGGELHDNESVDFFAITKDGTTTYYNFNGTPFSSEALAVSPSGITVFKENDKFGFKNASGKILIAPQYDYVDPLLWVNGFIGVRIGDKWSGKWGYVNSQGQEITAPLYEKINPFKYHHAIVCLSYDNHSYSVIDEKGQTVFNYSGTTYSEEIKDFDSVYDDLLGYFGCPLNYGFYNLNTGKSIMGIALLPSFENGYARVFNEDYKTGIVSTKGEWIVRLEYDDLNNFSEGIAFARNRDDGEEFLLDTKGNVVLKTGNIGLDFTALFEENPCSEGVIPAHIYGEGGGYGYIYNTFSSTLDQTIAQWGTYGNGESLKKVKQLVEQRAEYVDFYYTMGIRQMEEGKYNDASQKFDKVLSSCGYHIPSFYAKGYCLMNMGQYAEVIELYNRIYPKSSDIYYYMAICYYNLNQINRAADCCKYALQYDKNNTNAGELLTSINERKRYEQAQRLNNVITFLNALSNFTSTLNSAVSNYYTPQHTAQPHRYNPGGNVSTSGKQSKTCSSCNGTGYNSARERASFYSYSSDIKDNPPCDVCGDRSDHYHKSCSVCRGTGHVNY